MKNKIVAALVSLALVAGGLMALGTPESASAQPNHYYPVSITCEARSPTAIGVWTHANGNFACQRALQECAVRTPYGATCHVSRWWYNY